MSRADLARGLGLSRSTVSELVSRLLETELVVEGVEGPSRGGRRPILLEFREDAHLILGVEMGASHVGIALTDLRGRVLWYEEEDHPVREDPAGTRAHIRAMFETALDAAPLSDARDRLMGIGIAVPSPVDPRYPDRLATEVLPRWEGRSGFAELSEAFGVPVLVDNDANLGAVAELWWGAGQDVDHFTFIKLATGIGAGHIVKGDVYRGATSVAGEIGHMSVDPTGEPCICGNRGCLTTVAGTRALLRRAETLIAEYPNSPLASGPVTLRALEQASLSRDPLATEVIREAAHHLGVAISGMINLMNPGAVILGGSLTRVGDALLIPLRKAVVRRTLVSSVAASDIRLSALGDSSIAVGATTYVLASALADPSLFPTYRS
ncbi:MAG: ROK family transcriptional regulator [Gemmatimonadetes bacterium]|nr:ROK family transcriptional regulator [Gemmatimonadota bacterium]